MKIRGYSKTKCHIAFILSMLINLYSIIHMVFIEKNIYIVEEIVMITAVLFVYAVKRHGEIGTARKNKTLLLIAGLTQFIFFIGVHTEFYYGSINKGVFILSVVILVTMTTAQYIFYNKAPESSKFKIYLLIFFEIIFILGVGTIVAPWLMYAPFAILVTYLLYNEVKFVIGASILIAVLNIVAAYRHVSECTNLTNGEYMQHAYTLQGMFVVLFVATLSFVLKLNNIFNNEKIEEISKANNKSEKISIK